MARQFTMTILPDGQGDKREVVDTAILVQPGANQLVIAYGDLVPIHQQLEIANGWKWLWHGVRDRNLLDVQFLGAIMVTGAAITSLTEENRRTASDVAFFNDDDVLLAIGSGVTVGSIGRSATQMLDSAFRMLREFARENN